MDFNLYDSPSFPLSKAYSGPLPAPWYYYVPWGKVLIYYIIVVLILEVIFSLKYPKSKVCGLVFSFLAPGFGQCYFKAKHNYWFLLLMLCLSKVFSILIPDKYLIPQLLVCISSAFIMYLRIIFKNIPAYD